LPENPMTMLLRTIKCALPGFLLFVAAATFQLAPNKTQIIRIGLRGSPPTVKARPAIDVSIECVADGAKLRLTNIGNVHVKLRDVVLEDTSAAFGQTAPAVDNGPKYRPVILAVTTNGLAGDLGALFLEDKDGRLFAPDSFFKAMHLQASDSRTIGPDGTAIFDLARIPGGQQRVLAGSYSDSVVATISY